MSTISAGFGISTRRHLYKNLLGKFQRPLFTSLTYTEYQFAKIEIR